MLQAPMFDGLPFDPFTLFDDGFSPSEVGIGGRHVAEALVVALVVVMLDERRDLSLKVAGQVVVFQQDAVLHGLVPALDLALGLGMERRAAHMAHLLRKGAKWLAQGTIYPDVIESGGAKSKKAVTIKSHHNVGGLPETLGLKLLEPLRDLFKDEVRELGVALGLPPDMVYRHPFPGPGLGVRILGEVKTEFADLLRRADAIFIEELRNTICEKTGKSWYALTSQAFAVFLPVKSVGVMGDGRTYDYVVALRAVVTSDFMTANWAELPYSLLGKVSNRIINEVRGINRVVYDVSGKPPATIEWE